MDHGSPGVWRASLKQRGASGARRSRPTPKTIGVSFGAIRCTTRLAVRSSAGRLRQQAARALAHAVHPAMKDRRPACGLPLPPPAAQCAMRLLRPTPRTDSGHALSRVHGKRSRTAFFIRDIYYECARRPGSVDVTRAEREAEDARCGPI